MRLRHYLLLSCILLFSSCEKVDLSEFLGEKNEEGFPVVFNMEVFSQTDFDTRSAKKISEISEVINFAVFQNGNKIKTINQKRDEANFGTITVNLPEGDYEIVAVAHNGTGNATLTDPCKITFYNNKVTDTFAMERTITVESAKEVDVQMKRVVAMFRLQLDQQIPAEVAQLKFYYTGGSSTLDAVTGYGCVNSRQTEIRDVKSHEPGQVFEVYTFPHDDTGVLNMTITALDAQGNDYQVRTLPEVDVTVNKITTYYGTFFLDSQNSAYNGFSLMGDDEWTEEIKKHL